MQVCNLDFTPSPVHYELFPIIEIENDGTFTTRLEQGKCDG